YPETSELHGQPCGILSRKAQAKAYVFSFHLWGIEESAARQLVDYIMEHRSHPIRPEPPPPPLPEDYALMQNYPNPFNISTWISFDLPSPGHVKLEVYNILGQRVTVLTDEVLPAGPHTVVWNGRNRRGRTVASGVYLYRLTAGGRSFTRKMVLLK
ncbi:MAG: T9SS type A sorting domain-containing protein, partial [Candidatus Zixiibacteriota bacterium]